MAKSELTIETEGFVMGIKKKLLATVLSAMLCVGGGFSTTQAHGYPEADFTWQFVQGQTFEIIGEAGTTYDILTPGMTHIISQDGDTLDFSLDKQGDVYILAHRPDGSDFLYHLIVGGEENRTVIEHHVEHRTHHVSIGADNDGASADEDTSQFAQQILELVNRERRQRGIAPVWLSSELMDAAAIRAEEITRLFSHTRPNGEPCSSLIENGAYTVGENIAAGSSTPEAVMSQWMNSPGHKANILNGDYTELGVGYAYRSGSEYGHYFVQMFRRPMSKAIRHW